MKITEGLAEIKTIGKRIESKKRYILTYLTREERLRDPLEGGSKEAIQREMQGIVDLQTRLEAIRVAILKKNLETTLTVGKVTKPVFNWLVWRREVAPGAQNFFNQLFGQLQSVRQTAARAGVAVTAGEAAKPTDIMVNVNEKVLNRSAEEMEQILGDLDGQLSMINATTEIEV